MKDFLRDSSWQFYLFSEFCQKSAERKSPKKYFFFIFRFDVWPGARTLALRLISQHTTYKTTATSEEARS